MLFPGGQPLCIYSLNNFIIYGHYLRVKCAKFYFIMYRVKSKKLLLVVKVLSLGNNLNECNGLEFTLVLCTVCFLHKY